MWFKIPNLSGHKSLLAGETDFWLGLFVNGARMNYFVSGNGTAWNLICGDDGPMNGAGSIDLSVNAWHHVVFMRSGNTWRGLIDKLRMVGSLDDVRIYNRALSDNEVLALFEEGQ